MHYITLVITHIEEHKMRLSELLQAIKSFANLTITLNQVGVGVRLKYQLFLSIHKEKRM